ncbi:MAG: hypothetical protein GY803_30770 [Chloroflexi bacterium]|nr:hypothetical protein [Chloroflexota bacterium]
MRKQIVIFISVVVALATTVRAYALLYYSNTFDSLENVNQWNVVDQDAQSLTVELSDPDGPAPGALKTTQTDVQSVDGISVIVDSVPDNELVYVSACVFIPEWEGGAHQNFGLKVWAGNDTPGDSGWFGEDVTATTGDYQLLSVHVEKAEAATPPEMAIKLYTPTGVVYWDNIRVDTDPPPPCPSIAAPDGVPAPTPTPTPIPPLEPLALTGVTDISVDVPGPIPLPPVSDLLDLAPFWDITSIRQSISVVQTFFYLENIPEFFQIFFVSMGFVIALRAIIAIMAARRPGKHSEV